jgi:hypothetical protein
MPARCWTGPFQPVAQAAKAATMMAALAVCSQSWIAHQIGMVLPSPPKRQHNRDKGGRGVKAEVTKRAIATATKVASDDKGNGNGGKSVGDSDKGGGQATTRAMAAATAVVGNNEGNSNGNERAIKRVRVARPWQR